MSYKTRTRQYSNFLFSTITLSALFIVFIQAFENKVIPDSTDCSTKFCDTNRNCSAFESCSCPSYSLLCPDLYSESFTYFFPTNREIFGLNCYSVPNSSLTSVIQYIKVSVEQLNVKELKINSCCMDKKGLIRDKFDVLKHPSSFNVTVFQNMNWLQKLNLEGNCITDIDGTISHYLPNLLNLTLASNYLQNLTENVFHGLFNLEDLNLFLNELQEIHRLWFKDLKSLKNLDLRSNKLKSLPENVFVDLTNLESLALANNHLKEIPQTFIIACHRLKMLDLSFNVIESLPENLFSNSTLLKTLYLHNNELHSLPELFIQYLTNLRVVNLNNNKIDILSSGFLGKKKPNLMAFSLDNNEIADVNFDVETGYHEQPPVFSLTNNKLQTLYLPASRIWKSNFKLDLSNNCFSSMNITDPSENLEFPNELNDFACSNCCLSNLDPALGLKVKKSLILTKNQFSVLDLAIMVKFSHLHRIDLSFNKFETIIPPNEISRSENQYLSADRGTVVRFFRSYVNCDCKLWPFVNFISNYLNKNGVAIYKGLEIDVRNLICQSPDRLKKREVSSLKAGDILCEKSKVDGCPSGCVCFESAGSNSSFVDCEGMNLSEFPSDIPFKTKISLFLQNNRITTLPPPTAEIWQKLDVLNLHGNHIYSLKNFTIGPNLHLVRLENNNLTIFEVSTVALLKTKVLVTLSQNHWKCDCELIKVRDLILTKNTVLDTDNLKCWDSEVRAPTLFKNLIEEKFCPQTVETNSPIVLYICIGIVTAFIAFFLVTWCFRKNSYVSLPIPIMLKNKH